jgi:hypothetical protein
VESIALFMSISDADVYLTPRTNQISKLESLLITTSVADVLIEKWFPDFPLLNYETHRRHLLYQFKALQDTTEIPGKKFVFVHLWAPHPPFVFDETGNPIQPDTPYSPGDATGFIGTKQEYFSGYNGETSYLNSQLKVIIDGILSRSKQPPIIILQGDHGPGIHTSFLNVEDTCLQERFSILNAYYFPDGDYSTVAESVTPVNSFRIIFNKYFGTELPLLEDRHYYSAWLRPYQFTEVTGKTDLQCTFKP